MPMEQHFLGIWVLAKLHVYEQQLYAIKGDYVVLCEPGSRKHEPVWVYLLWCSSQSTCIHACTLTTTPCFDRPMQNIQTNLF